MYVGPQVGSLVDLVLAAPVPGAPRRGAGTLRLSLCPRLRRDPRLRAQSPRAAARKRRRCGGPCPRPGLSARTRCGRSRSGGSLPGVRVPPGSNCARFEGDESLRRVPVEVLCAVPSIGRFPPTLPRSIETNSSAATELRCRAWGRGKSPDLVEITSHRRQRLN